VHVKGGRGSTGYPVNEAEKKLSTFRKDLVLRVAKRENNMVIKHVERY